MMCKNCERYFVGVAFQQVSGIFAMYELAFDTPINFIAAVNVDQEYIVGHLIDVIFPSAPTTFMNFLYRLPDTNFCHMPPDCRLIYSRFCKSQGTSQKSTWNIVNYYLQTAQILHLNYCVQDTASIPNR